MQVSILILIITFVKKRGSGKYLTTSKRQRKLMRKVRINAQSLSHATDLQDLSNKNIMTQVTEYHLFNDSRLETQNMFNWSREIWAFNLRETLSTPISAQRFTVGTFKDFNKASSTVTYLSRNKVQNGKMLLLPHKQVLQHIQWREKAWVNIHIPYQWQHI